MVAAYKWSFLFIMTIVLANSYRSVAVGPSSDVSLGTHSMTQLRHTKNLIGKDQMLPRVKTGVSTTHADSNLCTSRHSENERFNQFTDTRTHIADTLELLNGSCPYGGPGGEIQWGVRRSRGRPMPPKVSQTLLRIKQNHADPPKTVPPLKAHTENKQEDTTKNEDRSRREKEARDEIKRETGI